MNALWISNIGSLYHEMYEPEINYNLKKVLVENSKLDANSYFWIKHFEKDSLLNLIDLLEDNIDKNNYDIPQYHSILANKDLFIENCCNIPKNLLCNIDTPQQFFSNLELASIVCKLYSDFVYNPFEITIYNGFELTECSSKTIYDNCLNPKLNPYLDFVKTYIIPLIERENPKIIFLQGKMSFYFAAISLLLKKNHPNIHICLTRHSSEYYSLNKINDLLLSNDILFKIIDSLILEYYDYTEKELISKIEENRDINSVPNLMFVNDDGHITENPFSIPNNTDVLQVYYRLNNYNNTSHKAFDIHFDPYIRCYWNKCTFCGINKKYHHDDIDTTKSLSEKFDMLKDLSNKCDYFWFIDEAIPSNKLRLIADAIIEKNIKTTWQVRCRAEKELIENNLPQVLANSGLKEIRIGLESASIKVLELMNKHPKGFSIDLVEKIISEYNKNSISVHCPVIIGFPQETEVDREITYDFLRNMKKKYPLFTFNINILNLDVSSTLYKHWGKYQLQQLRYPCEPKYFLDNYIAWIDSVHQQQLLTEANSVMREVLFPWMPANSLVAPTIFYRLCETSRNILRWKSNNVWEYTSIFSSDMELILSNNVVNKIISEDEYLFYCMDTHHYVIGNKYIADILNVFKNKKIQISIALRLLENIDPEVFEIQSILELIKQFYSYGFLKGSYNKIDIYNSELLKEEYNKIYSSKNLMYKIETDSLIINWDKLFTGGNALELGVGLGKNISYLLNKGYFVTGIDLSEVAINTLNSQYSTSNCNFYVEDIRNFSFLENNYSLIICSLVLSYFSDVELIQIIDKIYKSLTTGGYLYIIDLSTKDPLNSVLPENTTDHRNFFSCEKIKKICSNLEVIELSETQKKASSRIGCGGYFGLIQFLGKKH